MSEETVNHSKSEAAAAELERLRVEDAAIGLEIQRLFAEGRQLRENGATDSDLADINAELNELQRRRPASSRLLQLKIDAENERHGFTRLADGSYGKIQANGTVLSAHGSLAEFTDSDGRVYRDTPEDQRRRAEKHKAVVLAFQAQVTGERLSRTRARVSCLLSTPRRTPQARSPRPATRRAAGARSGQDPGDDDGLGEFSESSAGGRLCGCNCGESIEHLVAQARYLNETHRARAAKRRERHRAAGGIGLRDLGDYGVRSRAEYEALLRRVLAGCRCNGHHIGDEHCIKCGHDRSVPRARAEVAS